jgi:RimJ/RimL family protein N-acetyltransferase
MRTAVDWARGTGVVTRVELQAFAGNDAATRLYERLGFVTEGRRRRAVFRDGEYQDDVIMAILL